MDRLLGEQAARRRERSTERRITAARFPERKTLETFDWSFNARFIDRPQIEQLATGDFVRRRRNLIVIGQSGVGKSHLGQAIGLRLCALGHRVLYTTSAEMIRHLGASLADRSLPERLRYYFNWDLVLIDEFGFDRIEREECPQAAPLLYKVIESRHQKRSTAIFTNLDFDKWADYLRDPLIGMAFLDRFVEAATIIKIKKEAEVAPCGSKTRSRGVVCVLPTPRLGGQYDLYARRPSQGAGHPPRAVRPRTATPLRGHARRGRTRASCRP